jgi:microcompartment protein CcmL/EutN
MAITLAALALVAATDPAFAASSGEANVATLVSVTRLVRVQEKEGAPVKAAKAGIPLPEGAKVMTLDGAFAEISFSPAHFVRMGPSSTITIARLRRPESGTLRILLRVVMGRVRAAIDRSRAEGSDFGMYSASLVTAVKGTEYEINRESEDEAEVTVDEGKVDVAETKEESIQEAERVFTLLLVGSIGMKLAEGYQMNCRRGRPLPSASPTPAGHKSPLRNPGRASMDRPERTRPERRTAEPRGSGRERPGRAERPERTGRGGRGGSAAPSTPSVPGLPGIGFP